MNIQALLHKATENRTRLIIIAVITAAGAMQAAGGIDFLVRVATKIIKSNPKQLNYIAPLVSFVFTIAAGAGSAGGAGKPATPCGVKGNCVTAATPLNGISGP